jgi:hypothetical protein
MRLTQYRFGSVAVDETKYNRDVIITPNQVFHPWIRRQGHSLYPEDLECLMQRPPETLVIGTGAFGRLKVPAATRDWLESKGITLIELPTAQAVEECNKRLTQRQYVACGLHLTC